MENTPEVKTQVTQDSWGHRGVRTYYRLNEWFDNEGKWPSPLATVYILDTSTGHGWQGQMNKTEWERV